MGAGGVNDTPEGTLEADRCRVPLIIKSPCQFSAINLIAARPAGYDGRTLGGASCVSDRLG